MTLWRHREIRQRLLYSSGLSETYPGAVVDVVAVCDAEEVEEAVRGDHGQHRRRGQQPDQEAPRLDSVLVVGSMQILGQGKSKSQGSDESGK